MAISLFDGVNLGGFTEVGRSKIAPAELHNVKSAVVEEGPYGKQVLFTMVNGASLPRKLGKNSEGKFNAGESIDPSKVELVQLHKDGNEKDIIRVEVVD